MFQRFTNPMNLKLKCSLCGSTGRPFSKEGVSVGCGECGNTWDGMAEAKERELYEQAR